MSPPVAQPEIRRIWILDIDGTLMPTAELDNRCYWRAVHECFGDAPETLSLDTFTHVTDDSVLAEWMDRTRGRSPRADELAAVRDRFLALLEAEYRAGPIRFRPTEGLTAWLDRCLAAGDEPIAVATGGWNHTARFKLRAAGLDRYGLPLASSEDGDRRTAIMEAARQRAIEALGPRGASARDAAVTYIGDGSWDLRASEELGWGFVGIASGSDSDSLRAAGAGLVVDDFRALLEPPLMTFKDGGTETRAPH